MATVWVGAEESVDLPGVCVKTGVPTTVRLPMEASGRPSWPAWLLLFNVWAFLLARAFATEQVPVAVPVSARAFTRFHRSQQASAAIVIGGVAALVVGLAVGSYDSSTTGVALVVAGLVAGAVARLGTWVGLSFRRRDQAIVLTRCHPAFAEAVRARRAA